MDSPQPTPALEVIGLTKRFGDLLANDRINLRVERGTLHGIVGENGAGKSTLMKLLYGMYQPDAGQVYLNGAPRRWASPRDALGAGIGMVHQHFMLAGPFTALDNVILGAEPMSGLLVARRAALQRLEALAAHYNLKIDWSERVENLPVGIQQRLEILKLLYRNAGVLILDEPTAVLTPQEVSDLFYRLRQLRDTGHTILLTTHKLKEVLAVADRVTVLRGGRVVATINTKDATVETLADMMMGARVTSQIPVLSRGHRGKAALKVSELSLARAKSHRLSLNKVSLQVHAGEMVGLAGVEGNGQSDLLQAILHPGDGRSHKAGTIEILGRNASSWAARELRAAGVAVIPEDRIEQGLLTHYSAQENFLLGNQRLPQFTRYGVLNWSLIQNAARQALLEYDVQPSNPALPARQFSGGNQQKLIVAREFFVKPTLVLASQPTRGVDIGASERIHKQIIEARDAGAGVLLLSSDLDELMKLADRLLVMFEGRIVAEFERGEVSERELGLRMGGA